MDNINIQLPTDHIRHIKEYYNARLQQIENESSEIKKLLNELDSQYHQPPIVRGEQLSFVPKATTLLSNGYNPKWSLVKKAKFALNATGVPMTSREIVDYIIDNCEDSLKPERKRFMSSMSGTLSAKSKDDGIFKRTQNDADEFEYLIA